MDEQDARAVRVLIVDDELLFAGAVRDLLEREPAIDVVGLADNGADALDLARQTKPDVALVDIAMPGVDGLETTRLLRAARAATRVIVVSGLSAEGIADAAVEAGASAFLFKGRLHDEIAATILAVDAEPLPLH